MKSLSEFFSLLIYTGFEKKIRKPNKFYYIESQVINSKFGFGVPSACFLTLMSIKPL